MTEVWVNKNFEIDGDSYEIDLDLHNTLNNLAAKFYELHGSSNTIGFDFFESSHHQEKLMYSLALHAYIFNLKYGIE